ncbi:thiamine-repressible acid phosphatase pho4 [Schizosaccharomyces japonicus yFS275]|uniref:Thiamine-repressible acid phosphatase pho4 n=1 Tax=Schizosaccharomyces japonicus (strain yFS275 / FY16936) TaxID=402676 RepID=B6K5U1_SCHJY|nr:thiamine-repressible acid phosphatase pho4 [Schizosaccharomyces japonicus yFS275]EEB08895.1 thiamine-repressible acid phosphatase pho4 [Schizosaccharomyces japonicus yFS275]
MQFLEYLGALFAASLLSGVNARFTKFESFDTAFDLGNHLGSRSVYHEPKFVGMDNSFPEGCSIKQLHILQRHGSRNPEGGSGTGMAGGIDALQNRLLNGSIPVDYSIPENPFAFLKDWEPVIKVEDADALSSSGRVQLFDMGRQVYEHYSELFQDDLKYTVNCAAQDRVVESANWYLMGMFGREYANRTNVLYMAEDDSAGFNSLSSYYACPTYETSSPDPEIVEKVHDTWRGIFLKAPRERLSGFLKGYNLTDKDVRNLFSICQYEIALKDESEFCNLFTPTDVLNFEYDNDLDFAYWGGPAASYEGKILGAAYVNSVAEQMRKLANGTLTEDDQQVFYGFTHDAQIIPVENALGFFPDINANGLPADRNPFFYSQKTSDFVPFAGNLLTEVFQCSDNKYYVRHLVNQQVFPLTDCGFGPSGSSDGLCELEAYLSSSVRSNYTLNGRNLYVDYCKSNATTFIAEF